MISFTFLLWFNYFHFKRGKGSGVWPSMVTHTWNLCSAFNPSMCTHTVVHLGSSWGFGALLKGLTSVVILRVERVLVIHSPHLQSLPDLRFEPTTFGLQVQLSIRPRLPQVPHCIPCGSNPLFFSYFYTFS